jgi:very-short-patch-repair endonuclease
MLALRARQHRSNLNHPEELLWRELSAGKLGIYFRRQVPLAGNYIVDMLAPSIRLVVEVDGRCHERRRRADAWRDERLRRLGYRIVRIAAEDVLRDLAGVVARIREELSRFPPSRTPRLGNLGNL